MNQDQVKDLLLKLDRDVEDFAVIFSGKASKKVDGLYHPDTHEIIIHNKNFAGDNALIYTAIHEFAHHLQHVRSPIPISTRAHTRFFWDIFHRLLFAAEGMGIYLNVFKHEQEFVALTKKIREEFLQANGSLMKDFGKLLLEAGELCRKHEACFDDYVDRELLLHRTTAKVIMRIAAMDIDPVIGYENMKTVASIRDEGFRDEALQAFKEGQSPDMVMNAFAARGSGVDAGTDPLEKLLRERDRIEKTILSLSDKLTKIERRINEMKG